MDLAVPLDDQFNCCICLEILTDPTSIPCGHTFCLDCIEGFWDTKAKPECPLCKDTFSPRPQLRINRGYAEIIRTIIERTQEEDGDVGRSPGSRKNSLIQLEADEVPSHFCRKHNQPLTKFCRTDQKPVCEKCTERNHKKHDTVLIENEGKRVRASLRATKASIQQMMHTRKRKLEEIKYSVDLSKKCTEKEKRSSARVCTTLIKAIERHQAEVVEELEERQREAERRAEELEQELEQELELLQWRSNELQSLEHAQDPIHLLRGFAPLRRLPSTRDWSEVPVHTDNCMGTVTRSVSKLVHVCQELATKLSAEEADKINQYAVDVTLDPETASGWLVLSPDRKKVSVSNKKSNAPLPDSPQRFDSCVCVLGKQGFACGRRYWVVEVADKTDFDLGVAQESINRKGTITVRPDSGYWAICRRKGDSLSACAGPSVPLHPQETPKKIGIFLDYEEGLVSFYDADTKSHIYTYTGCDFSQPLYPYFNPCLQENGRNTSPLVICPVEGRVRDITIESAV
ncbi:E3 ubiquitin-protein ligase TRIM39-like [Centropristis striata]|uniref:E3 ubiquitin-protein ligase TRIM39-like n=1 Tax=Centropristis striata TaxID=184440 RepID=UPI0027E20A10|nr:E3 ubiquitin-protein ligase TRIM39-like [Centropristis striata]